MEKFKGKFVEACQVNWDDFKIGNWARMKRDYETGWERFHHCRCESCSRQRQEKSIERCQGTAVPLEERCQGCKNTENGIKIRDWFERLYE